jgi:hypothetical protein
MPPWIRYLIAFVVFCHGFIYVRIGSMLPGPIAEWKGNSWLLGEAIVNGDLERLTIGLHVAAGIATIACAAALAFVPVVPGWWRPLAIAGGALGIVAFGVFWDGQTRLLCEEGLIGAIVSAALAAAAIVALL